MDDAMFLKYNLNRPGWEAQLIRVLSPDTKVTGSIPGLGHMQEWTNECINNWNNKLIPLSLSLLLSYLPSFPSL